MRKRNLSDRLGAEQTFGNTQEFGSIANSLAALANSSAEPGAYERMQEAANFLAGKNYSQRTLEHMALLSTHDRRFVAIMKTSGADADGVSHVLKLATGLSPSENFVGAVAPRGGIYPGLSHSPY
jgi:hypothetical protein